MVEIPNIGALGPELVRELNFLKSMEVLGAGQHRAQREKDDRKLEFYHASILGSP